MRTSPLIDTYIRSFPRETIVLLNEVRSLIQQLVPEAEEAMKYGIPTYVLHGNLVHFAGYKNHIGFYPGAEGIAQFKDEFKNYEWSKGAVQFPLDQPMPIKLITRIVQFRVKQNIAKKRDPALKGRAIKGRAIKGKAIEGRAIKEQSNKDFMSTLSAPARRALENAGITTLKKLAKYSEREILALHGIGKTAIPKLLASLQAEGLTFKTN